MAEATLESMRADVDAAFERYMDELKQSGANWETKPAAAEGEANWCAREVAEHIAGSGPYFGVAVAKAIGVEGPRMQRYQLESAGVALSKTEESHALLVGILEQLSQEQLATRVEKSPIGETTVAGLVGVVTHHLKDHAGQLKTLRGG